MLSPLSTGLGQGQDADSSMDDSSATSDYGSPSHAEDTAPGSFFKKKDPDPFFHYELISNVASPSSPLMGRSISWSLKDAVPIEDLMYPSLHCLPEDKLSPLSSPTSLTLKYAKKNKLKLKKGKISEMERERQKAREGSPSPDSLSESSAHLNVRDGHTGVSTSLRVVNATPIVRNRNAPAQRQVQGQGQAFASSTQCMQNSNADLHWTVEVSPIRASQSRILPTDNERERVGKDIQKRGEVYLRERLKRNLRSLAHAAEERRKADDFKKNNLLLNAKTSLKRTSRTKQGMFSSLAEEEELVIALAKPPSPSPSQLNAERQEHAHEVEEQGKIERRQNLHGPQATEPLIAQSPDELYASLTQSLRFKQIALAGFEGSGWNSTGAGTGTGADTDIGAGAGAGSANSKKLSTLYSSPISSKGGDRNGTASTSAAEATVYKQKTALQALPGSADHVELEDGLLMFRVRNALKAKGDKDNATLRDIQESPDLDPLLMKQRVRKANLLEALVKKRSEFVSSGEHLRRALRQNAAVMYGVDYSYDHGNFHPKLTLRSHSETDRSKIDFSPIQKAPSHSRRVAQDVLLVEQYDAKILPEIFIKPHEKITGEYVKKCLAREEEIEALSQLDRQARLRMDDETVGANSTVNLASYGVGDEQGLCLGQSLLNFDSLQSLILKENRLSSKSIPTIFANISTVSVMFIDISCNKLHGPVCFEAISKFFTAKNVCKHLNMSKCGLTCDDIVELCAGLSSQANQPLEELILSSNSIAARGAVALSQYISRLTPIDADSQSKQRINPKALSGSNDSISSKSICNIKTLNLSWNKVSHDGVIALAGAITISQQLKNLDISGNSVSDSAAQRLATALSSTSSLEVLNLQQNHVSSPSCFVFARVLTRHPSMKVLDLSLNPVGEPGARSIFRSILQGLNCFVMMRSCTFEEDNTMFNHSNPSADSPYTLDLNQPYQHSVACTLLSMMAADNEQCKITESSYRDGPKSAFRPLGLHNVDGKACEKGSSSDWVVPTAGTLQLSFVYSMKLPTAGLAISENALFVLKIIIVTARTEGDRRNWLKLLCKDVYFTTTQAQGIIDHFVEKQVIGIGGLHRVDVMNAVWPHLLDPHNQVEFFLKNIVDMEQRRKVMYGMSLDMFRFNWVNPTGHWRFVLSDPNQRIAMSKFIAINKMESEYSRDKSGREDTSQMEDWCNFRNATYTGGHENDDDIEAPAVQRDSTEIKFVFKPFIINREFMEDLPYVGVLEFDYVSTRRPLQDFSELDVNEGNNAAFFGANQDDDSGAFDSYDLQGEPGAEDSLGGMLSIAGSRPHTSGSALSAIMSSRPASSDALSSSRGSETDGKPLDTSRSIGSAASNSSTTERDVESRLSGSRPGSVHILDSRDSRKLDSRLVGLKHPQTMLITDSELRDFLNLIGLSTRERCMHPDTLFKLSYLQLASTKYYFHARSVVTVLECFSRDAVVQARVVVALFSRLWDLHNFDFIMRNLSTLAQQETILRLGYLNIMNPLKPAMDYCIDLRYADNRKALVFCLETGPSEGADQLRSDSASDLTLTDMYSSINRVLKNCVDARVMYSYGEVGERTTNVSWNIRTAALKKFLVGTNPWPKGIQRIIFQYNKLLKDGLLSIGPIEQQYEVMMKRQEEERAKAHQQKEDAQKKKKAKKNLLQGAIKRVSTSNALVIAKDDGDNAAAAEDADNGEENE
jgi:hypothetical protein